VEKKLVQSGEQPSNPIHMNPGMIIHKDYAGSELPENEWKLVNRITGLELVNRFPKLQVERAFVRWSARAGKAVTLALWSSKKTLAPHETVSLEADYGLTSRKVDKAC
jgi:hypothetical protein